jgi:GTP pyrophosphokinase/guanosine-3',5'-bis(diphosphate) 3'-pyrophosphohydrolase
MQRHASLAQRRVRHGTTPSSFAALLEARATCAKADVKRVREAYKFADEAHLGQFRASGEPYITHPIAVAGLCADWKLDAQAIMAALMHDADGGLRRHQGRADRALRRAHRRARWTA